MVNLMWKDLTYHKLKLVLTMVGLIFSSFLVQFSFGMYFGAIREYSRPAREWDHDAWVTWEDMEMLMAGGLLNENVTDDISNIKGVKSVNPFLFLGGGIEGEEDVRFIRITGIDLSNEEIEPWESVTEVKKGDVEDWRDLLEKENTIIVDESLKDYMDVEVGDKLNIDNMVEFEIAGFTTGGLLMGTPQAWTSLDTARNLIPWAKLTYGNYTTAIGVKFEKGYDFNDFKEDTKDIKEISVYTTEEIEVNTDDYIMNKMGVGMMIFMMAGIGLIVALVIVSITIYQSVLEKIPLFGTLKAIGAEKGFVNKMMYGQVFIIITIGFVFGTLMATMASSPNMQIAVNPTFSIWLYVLVLATSLACSFVSIRKVHKIDPAIVFRR